MNCGAARAALTAVAVLAMGGAHADFNAATADYQAGRFAEARSQFNSMAELGDCSSQFNLGLMVRQGQGGARNIGAGIGWLQAAASNGCQELVGGRVEALKGTLTPEEQLAAADIVARYGHDALRAQGIVEPQLTCRERTAAVVLSAPAPEYPRLEGARRRNALVIGALTIGVDGRARDPEILLATPDGAFAAAAIEAWLNARFTPARRGAAPEDSRLVVRLPFTVERGETLWNGGAFKDARSAAEAGDPAAEYLVGLAATADPTVGITPARGAELLILAARDGNAAAQYWLGAQLRSVMACHPEISGAAWFRPAAASGNASAQLALATDLLGGTPGETQLREARALLERAAAAADSYYVRKHVAALLAAAPFAALRDPATAQQLAGRLATGEVQSDPQMFEVLAAADAAGGDFAGAAAQQQIAIRKAHELGWNTRAMEQRLAAYRDGRAWQGELFAG
jgi:TPR repeat protein